jgi:hypothetical protein
MTKVGAVPGIVDAWRDLILRELGNRPPVVRVLTPVRPLRGVSHAVVADCSDGQRYVVKGRQVMRPLIADHIVGRLAGIIGAPVPEVQLVDVPNELISPSSYLAHFEAGTGHGSVFVPECRDWWHVEHANEADNPERFAALAVLFGWTDAGDQQFLYSKTPPHLVWSTDHGAFFTGSSDWTVETLSAASSAAVDQWIVAGAGPPSALLRAAMERLQLATDAVIARVVAIPPDEWGITLDERVALADYLARRRDAILAGASAS